jgi:hypothetical protein
MRVSNLTGYIRCDQIIQLLPFKTMRKIHKLRLVRDARVAWTCKRMHEKYVIANLASLKAYLLSSDQGLLLPALVVRVNDVRIKGNYFSTTTKSE